MFAGLLRVLIFLFVVINLCSATALLKLFQQIHEAFGRTRVEVFRFDILT